MSEADEYQQRDRSTIEYARRRKHAFAKRRTDRPKYCEQPMNDKEEAEDDRPSVDRDTTKGGEGERI